MKDKTPTTEDGLGLLFIGLFFAFFAIIFSVAGYDDGKFTEPLLFIMGIIITIISSLLIGYGFYWIHNGK